MSASYPRREEFCNQKSQKKAGCCDFLQDIGRTLDDQITHLYLLGRSQGLDCRGKSLGSSFPNSKTNEMQKHTATLYLVALLC